MKHGIAEFGQVSQAAARGRCQALLVRHGLSHAGTAQRRNQLDAPSPNPNAKLRTPRFPEPYVLSREKESAVDPKPLPVKALRARDLVWQVRVARA